MDPLHTDRTTLLTQLAQARRYDVAVIGGGATGLGVALDAASRGLSVVLVESHDFAKGTSSRATKLVHGGVRYLAQGNISLVREALHERSALLRNAPHLAQPLPFLLPAYQAWKLPFYGIGLKAYDLLAGRERLKASAMMGAAAVRKFSPGVNAQGLRGGIEYWDGQFDDARLALALARTAARHGALLVNYCAATELRYENDRVAGLRCVDKETGIFYDIDAGCVVNATGVWVDDLRLKDGQATHHEAAPMVAPSQGVHVVVDRKFWPGEHALLVPSSDGRVLFAVPWLGKVLLGTTDAPRQDLPEEPKAADVDVDFILREAARYLVDAPTRADVLSVWAGLRPLIKPTAGAAGATKKISREHTIELSASGLVTVSGGKWTTYRAMAEDVLTRCIEAKLVKDESPCKTADLPLVGSPSFDTPRVPLSASPGLHLYGNEAAMVQSLPGADRMLCPGLSEAMVRFAARFEYARTVEDVLARRSRLLFLDAKQALAVAPAVADILREELGVDPGQAAFEALARAYLVA
ncbi:glycerol-3-phosphate dehydrogenase/oxidase [Pigmentiphaga aceris]|nr:glycerol-3-phosphate dehydrogenase/oxidase [Pigmentiphaga aceris]